MTRAKRAALADSLAEDLVVLSDCRIDDLRRIWRERLQSEPPPLKSPEVLRSMLAYRLQETALGGLTAPARRKLTEIAAKTTTGRGREVTPLTRLRPGVLLERDWKGMRHEVRVVEGGFAYGGDVYESLSEIARSITGTRWNGPLFFGLRDKPKQAA